MVEYKKETVFSKSYTTTVNVSAGGLSTENFISQVDIDEYAPFDTLQVLNADVVNMGILFDLNPDNMATLSANGSLSGDSQKFSQIQLKNLDAAADHTAGAIYILVQKTIYTPIEV